MLDRGSAARRAMALKILNWTAWSIRPLEPQEMLAALATRTELDTMARQGPPLGENVCPATDEELLSFCPQLLEIGSNRQVAFRNEHFRSLIRSPWSTALGFPSAESAHESLAAVCFRHLGCLHQETILRPWVRIGSMLRSEVRRCHLRSYCTNHWQDHYRAAETSSRRLVAMLHNTLDAAFSEENMSIGPSTVPADHRMSTGVWICSLWDLKILGRTYLEMGAEINHCAGPHEAPLHIAAANSSTNMLRLLLDRGADPDIRDRSGLTALHQACRTGSLDVATLLLQRGADPESSINDVQRSNPPSSTLHRSPLHFAATYGHSSLVKALLQAGLNLNTSTTDSRSAALHFAVEHGNEDVVRYLLDWEPDIETGTALSKAALKLAIAERHDAIVKLLVARGAKISLSSASDDEYLENVLGGEAITATMQQFQSLSFNMEDSHHADGRAAVSTLSSISSISRSPVIVIPTSSSKFDDTIESAAECGWTVVENMELDA
jgi:ankyrin repeat protein